MGDRRLHGALTDDVRQHHDALTLAIDRLERALAAAASGRVLPWVERVARELEVVREAVRQHVANVEGRGKLFAEVRHEAPRLSARVKALEQEHEVLVARAAALADRLRPVAEDTDFADLRVEAASLLTTLRAHRAAEADLIYEAFWIDLGVGD